ncbi:hypothetical protein QYM36_009461 [Artemia franciscana]|uniref:Peptidase A2 domain-containing protein n=1 Tax=Artemia franciscana TaxID=6661 RepID=A0AA88I1N1_ARTSF|nr:hypothetical protein QYM36_009461 [Artemia franciscana]
MEHVPNYIFRADSQRNQANGETIESYVTQVKVLVKDCEFETLEDQLVRDQFVFGVKNAIIRERLLSKGAKLTLARAIESTEDRREFTIESVSTEEKVEKPYSLIRLTEKDSELAFKIDTGAKASILPLKDFSKLARKPALLPTAYVLTSYNGEQLKVLGTANLKVQYKNQTPQAHTFHVVCTDRAPILSRQSSKRHHLIKFVLSVSNPASVRPVIQNL